MDALTQLFGALPPLAVLVVVGLIVVAEAAFVAGLVLPATTSLVALGLAAHFGAVSAVAAVTVAVAAEVAGGTAGYLLGRRSGQTVRTTRAGRWIGEKRWDRASHLFTRHGGKALFLGPWVAGTRTLVPRLVGMNGLPYRIFVRWHAPGAVLWAVWVTGAAYLVGASYQQLAAQAGRAAGALAVLLLVLAAVVVAGRWFGRHPGPAHAVGSLLNRRMPRERLRADVLLATGLLAGTAAVLGFVIPAAVRFSGLDGVDDAVAGWARDRWTPDGYRFALELAATPNPEAMAAVSGVLLLLARWWWIDRRGTARPSFVRTVGPALPVIVFGPMVDLVLAPSQRIAPLPPSGWLPFPLSLVPAETATGAFAKLAGGETAQLTAATGLLVWVLVRDLPRPWTVLLWTVAAAGVAACASCFVYLNWSGASECVAALLIGTTWTALTVATFRGLPCPDGDDE